MASILDAPDPAPPPSRTYEATYDEAGDLRDDMGRRIAGRSAPEGAYLAPAPTPTLGALPRPTKWTPEIEERLVAELESGGFVHRLARDDPTMPSAHTVQAWEYQDPLFRGRLDRARLRAADALVERGETTLIGLAAGEGAVSMTEIGRARELAHHWRWRAERLNPARYGRQVLISMTVDHVISIKEEAPEWLARLMGGSRPARQIEGTVSDAEPGAADLFEH